LSECLALNGQIDEALGAARQAVDHNPDDPRAKSILSMMLAKYGRSANNNPKEGRDQALQGSNEPFRTLPNQKTEGNSVRPRTMDSNAPDPNQLPKESPAPGL
jgi:hypothetical protein